MPLHYQLRWAEMRAGNNSSGELMPLIAKKLAWLMLSLYQCFPPFGF